MSTLTAKQGRPAAALIAEPREYYGRPESSSTGARNALGSPLRAQLRATVLQQVDGWLDEREIIGLKRFLGRQVAAGRGRASTANVLTAIFIRLRHGEAVLNLSEIALEAGYSRPSVYRAVQYVAAPKVGQPKLLRVHPQRTGPRRPGWWQIRLGIIPCKDEFWKIQEAHKYARSSLSVNLSNNSSRETNTAKPQAAPAAQGSLNNLSLQGATRPQSTQVDDPQDLLRWLDSPR